MSPQEEYDFRVILEQQKAVEKYGEIALLPAGHPEKDVHDYCINELVGLRRYGEMIVARAKLLDPESQRFIMHTGEQIGKDLIKTSTTLALAVIRLRQHMQRAGLLMGASER